MNGRLGRTHALRRTRQLLLHGLLAHSRQQLVVSKVGIKDLEVAASEVADADADAVVDEVHEQGLGEL